MVVKTCVIFSRNMYIKSYFVGIIFWICHAKKISKVKVTCFPDGKRDWILCLESKICLKRCNKGSECENKYRKVAISRLSRLVAHSRIFRLFMKGKFDAYVLWPLTKSFQNLIVDRRPVYCWRLYGTGFSILENFL